MPRRDPKLATKYENDDPDYSGPSSSSQASARPQRQKKGGLLENLTNLFSSSPKSDNSESPDVITSAQSLVSSQKVETSANHSPQVEETINSLEIGDIFPFDSSIFSNSQVEKPTEMDEEAIRQIVQAVVATQSEIKSSVPKIDLQKLNMSNYVDWAKKMKYALQLHQLWVDPETIPNQLSRDDKKKNEKAILFMACYLDDQNASFVNHTNEKCFISAWNSIKRFHQPRSATVLTEIHRQIQATKHVAGQSIESHLMKLEAQFSRFHEIDKKLDEEHLVALILASVSDSSDFVNVFHSAMWEEESSLTIAKVKSVLIATQRRQLNEQDEQAHRTKLQQKSSSSNSRQRFASQKRHSRRPRDPINGWRCKDCEMDNHTRENCFRRSSSSQQHRHGITMQSQQSKRVNHVEDDSQSIKNAEAFSVHTSQRAHQHISPRHVPYTYVPQQAQSIQDRLGPPIKPNSPYHNIQPQKSSVRQDEGEDILDIHFNPNYEYDEMSYDDISPPGSNNFGNHFMSHSLNQFTNGKFINSSQKINQGQQQTEITKSSSSIIPKSANYFNSPNHKKFPLSNNFNLMNFNLHNNKNFNPKISANCNHSNMNKTQKKSTSESVWIIDSGATLHMCKSENLLSNFIPQVGHNVIISDGSTIPIHGFGTLTIFVQDYHNNLKHKLILSNVAVVPKLSVNLISVRALASLGVSIKFTKDSCYIQHPQACILLASLSNSSYILKISNTKKTEGKFNAAHACIHDWHRKMGHRNIAHINKVKNALKLNVEKCNCPPQCIGCLKGKLHALPFPQLSEKPANPRDIITTDICGAFRTQSIGGSKYFVTFTCANSDYTEVAAIKSKSDCKTELMNFIRRCKTQFGQFPKIIRSDRGGEYLDHEFQTFLDSNGIIFQCTVPRCSQQNGISERKNRTLLEAIRTMLMTKNLPKHLWAEALHHANNTFNNIPKEPDSPSPKEIFFGKSFNYPFIEFGAPVFHTTNPQNRSKLAERGIAGIFLGVDHNSKGFRIYSEGKIRIERHVTFLKETKNQNQKEMSSEILQVENEDCNQFQEASKMTKITTVNEPRRSERIQFKQAHSISPPQNPYEPNTYKQAISCPDKEKWLIAMETELRSIEENNTWSAVELPKGRTAIGCRWVFKIKRGETENDIKYKARLVAQGFTQKFGVDYDEIFAPVTRSSTFRTLLAVASARKLFVQQFDVKSAFLNGTLSEEIYIKPPPNFTEMNKVLRLHKSLYGLKQAARVWNQTLNKAMSKEGFMQSKHDECLYIYKFKSDVCYAVVHVDDMIFSSNSMSLIHSKIEKLNESFELKCLGEVRNYLGIEISKDEKGIFAISQTSYIQKIASEFELENSKGSKYPLAPGYHTLVDENFLNSNKDYRKLIGMLLYVSTNTRPDISAAVAILAQRISKPRELDFTEALRIVKYLMSTKDEKLHMFDERESISLTAYADSDWAEDRETRKSISGIICKVFGASVSWSSRKQNIVATSTTESEFYALSEAVKEVQWLNNILHDFHVNVKLPIVIHSDNQSTIKMVENSKFSSRTKHIDVRLHFVRECVYEGKINLKYCASENNVADILTKPLAGIKMKYLRHLAALK